MKRYIWMTVSLVLIAAMLLSGCGKKATTGGTAEDPYKVAFIYIGPPGDLG